MQGHTAGALACLPHAGREGLHASLFGPGLQVSLWGSHWSGRGFTHSPRFPTPAPEQCPTTEAGRGTLRAEGAGAARVRNATLPCPPRARSHPGSVWLPPSHSRITLRMARMSGDVSGDVRSQPPKQTGAQDSRDCGLQGGGQGSCPSSVACTCVLTVISVSIRARTHRCGCVRPVLTVVHVAPGTITPPRPAPHSLEALRSSPPTGNAASFCVPEFPSLHLYCSSTPITATGHRVQGPALRTLASSSALL